MTDKQDDTTPEELPIEENTPLEVKITNQPTPPKESLYPNPQKQEMECDEITEEQIQAFIDGEENA